MSIKKQLSSLISSALLIGLPAYTYLYGSVIAANITAVVLTIWVILMCVCGAFAVFGRAMIEFPGLEKETRDKLITAYHENPPFGWFSMVLNVAVVATLTITGYTFAAIVSIIWIIGGKALCKNVRKKYPMELTVIPSKV